MWGPNRQASTQLQCRHNYRSKVRNEPTSDQVKGPPVLWVRSHLTGQQVQLGWRSIDLKRDTHVLMSVCIGEFGQNSVDRCTLIWIWMLWDSSPCVLTVLWEMVRQPNFTPHFLFCHTFLILQYEISTEQKKSNLIQNTGLIQIRLAYHYQPWWLLTCVAV